MIHRGFVIVRLRMAFPFFWNKIMSGTYPVKGYNASHKNPAPGIASCWKLDEIREIEIGGLCPRESGYFHRRYIQLLEWNGWEWIFFVHGELSLYFFPSLPNANGDPLKRNFSERWYALYLVQINQWAMFPKK